VAGRSKLRWAAWGVGALLGLIILALALLHTPPARRYALKKTVEIMDRQGITFDSSEFNYNLLDLSATLSNVVVRSPQAPDLPALVRADRVSVDIGLRQLIGGKIHIEDAGIRNPQLYLVIDEKGRTNIPDTPETQKKEETRINFLIDKLLIAGGDVRVEDRRQKVAAHLPLAELTIDGNAVTNTHDVLLKTREGGVVSFENRTLAIRDVSADVLLREKAAQVRKLTASLGDSRISASGLIDGFDTPRLDVQGDTSLALAPLVAFAGVNQKLDGQAQINFKAAGTVEQLLARATVDGQDLSIDRLRGIDLKAEAEYDAAASRARVASLNVISPSGTIRGTADLALKPVAGQSTANISTRSLDLHSLSAAFKSPVRIASRATADIAARWPALEFKSAAADATIRLAATRSTPAKDVIPVSGAINAKTQGERVIVDIRELRAMDARAAGQVRIVNQKALAGDVRLDAPDLAATIASAEDFLGKARGTLAGTPVTGPLNVTAGISGTVQNPSVAARLEALGLTAGDLKGIDIRATADYNPSRVVLNEANLSWREQVITASGTVGLKGANPPIELTAQSQNISIQSVLAGVNRTDLPISGNAGFSADVRGTTKSPEADVTLSASGLSAYNETLGALNARAQLRGRTVDIPELRLTKPQDGGDGSLVAQGSYHLDSKQFSMDAKSDNLKVVSLMLPDGRPVRSELNLTARGEGTPDNPVASLDLSAKDVQFDSQAFGDLDVNARVANQQANVAAKAPAFNLAANAEAGIKEPYAGKFEVRADGVDLAKLPVKIDQPVAGRVTAKVRGSGPLKSFVEQGEATAEIAALDLQYKEQPIRSDGPIVASYAKQMLTIDRATLLLRESQVSLSGKLPLDDRAGSGAIKLAARLDLPSLMQYVPTEQPPEQRIIAQGTATIDGTITGTLKRIDPDIVLSLANGSFAGGTLKKPVTNVNLNAHVRDGALDLQTASAQLEAAVVNASGVVPFALLPATLPVELPRRQGAAQFTAELKALNLSDLGPVPDNVSGTISAKLEAEAARPEIEALNGRLSFPDLRVKLGSYPLEQKGTSEILLQNGVARVSQFLLSGPETKLEIAGTAGLIGDRPLDVKVAGNFDASIASAFTETVQAQGATELQIAVTGTAQNPQAQGFLQMAGAQIGVRDPRVGIEDLNIRVDLAGTRATLSRLNGTINGGDLSGGGSIEYADGALRNTSLNVKAAGLYMNVPEDLRTLSDVDLRLTTAGEQLVVGGEVRILEGGYTEEKLTRNLLARATATRPLELTKERSAFVEKIRFDLHVVTQNPIVIDNSLAEAEISADLRLLGNPYEPGLSGRLILEEGGELRLQERTYIIERGVITFTSDRRIEPNLDILANTSAEGYEITLQVSGPPGDTETTLTSDPSLPEPDILAILITGKTMEEIRGNEFEVASNQVLSFLTGRVGSQLGRTLAGATGLSTVRIEPNLIAAETDPSARLTLGQDITRNLELIYSMDLVNSSDQIYVAQYDISKRFTTRGVRQADGSFRFDFNHDLRFGGVPEPRRGRRGEQRRIGNINIAGNQYFSQMQLADKFKVDSGDRYDFFKTRKGIDRIEKLYLKQNLLESRVKLQREQRENYVDLTLKTDPGARVDLVFEGMTVPGDVQEKVRDAWVNGIFELQRAESAVQALRTWLIDENHLQPKIEHKIAKVGEDRKRVVFDIQPGPRFSNVELVFDGARGMEQSKLRDVIEDQKLSTDVYVAPGKVTEILTMFYHEFGYLEAEVQQPRYELDAQSGAGKVVFPVAEGPQYRVGNVAFEGNAAIEDAQLAAAAPFPKGESYRPVLREHAMERLREVYWAKGYNDVEMDTVLDRRPEAGLVDIRVNITENRQSVVNDIVIEGNDKTSKDLIRSSLELESGSILDLKKLGESRRNLYNSGAFSLVEIAREDVTSSEGGEARSRQTADAQKPVRLRVRVREIQPYQLRYGALFDTERGPGGIVDISNRNSLGSARVLGFRGRYDSQLQEARVYFSQPLLRRFPVKTIVSPFIRRERNPETSRSDEFGVHRVGFSVQQEARPWENYIWNYGYRLERTRTFDAGPNVLPELLADPPIRIGSLTSTLTRETRDEVLDATRGSFMSQAFQLAPSWLGSQRPFVKYFGQYFKYVPLQKEKIELFTNEILRPRLVYAGGVRLGLATGIGDQLVPLSERFFAGGGTTIRGFEQNSLGPLGPTRQFLGGEAMLVINNEVRFPLFWIFDGVGFSDIGNVWQSASDFSFGDIRKTAGVGLRLRAPWFLLRLDYGIVLDHRPGEPRGRVFFSIGQAF
jgi:outer membrane protein assembly complex protein YaeT